MKSINTTLLTIALAIGLAINVNAQSKIAHIDTQAFIEAMPAYQDAMNQIKQVEQTYQAEIDDLLKEAQKKNERYKAEAPTKTEEENQSRMQELQEMQNSIMEYNQTASRDVQKKREELMRPVLEKARNIIQEVAREKGFDYVLDSTVGSGVLLADGYNLLDDAKAELSK
ncbi:OmpH family outer membrane protein [Mesohalobacter halotolerans]|jgi:outer membrane protein|uniref:OmpH family outer membrane protein n=1 Tax=Mesohalobacter halotolerans TaxID=1883405 RepID=A0A4V6AL79_9FLAO|nr:OmpH family outer membrane protein [Mesohalobacter halotolerans]MBS3737635.1 OmpH family outer membrane protein [Psychroflexus sp.]NBC58361.1 OmpH family outer membrane protein [Bacteroidota bacterium]TKS55465.1 OmpH family outer membrane protein [Mesohalobacter halotolerans]